MARADIDWSERSRRYEALTWKDQEMAEAVAHGDTARLQHLPEAIPRGHPPAWYRVRAERYEEGGRGR